MTQVSIELANIPDLNLKLFMFEPKDDITLRAIEQVLLNAYPEVAKVIRWTDADETRLPQAFDVVLEFRDDQSMMEWVLKWT